MIEHQKVPVWIGDIFLSWVNHKKTGSITINFFNGGVTSLKKEETRRPPITDNK